MDTEAWLAIFLLSWKKPWGNINGGQAESMCRLTHVIPSLSIKDRTVVGASDKIEHMPIT